MHELTLTEVKLPRYWGLYEQEFGAF